MNQKFHCNGESGIKAGNTNEAIRSAMHDESRGDVAERVGPIYITIREMAQVELTKL